MKAVKLNLVLVLEMQIQVLQEVLVLKHIELNVCLIVHIILQALEVALANLILVSI